MNGAALQRVLSDLYRVYSLFVYRAGNAYLSIYEDYKVVISGKRKEREIVA